MYKIEIGAQSTDLHRALLITYPCDNSKFPINPGLYSSLMLEVALSNSIDLVLYVSLICRYIEGLVHRLTHGLSSIPWGDA